MGIDDLCMGCMSELYGEKQCPKCGFYVDSPQISPFLPLKSQVGDKYIVGKLLSSNSEGATYIGYDTERKCPVVIREYLPERFSTRTIDTTALVIKEYCEEEFNASYDKFLDLWRGLARLRGHSALIPVTDIVECNNTAYAISEHVESITLREFLLKSKTGYLNWDKAKALFMPVLTSLESLHSVGIVHGGINPDNLLIGRDGKLRLTGFSIDEVRREGTAFSPELFDGYTPLEQYRINMDYGPWSDVYAFCAVIYRALVGTVPQDSVSRASNDQLIIPAKYAEIIPVYVINALTNGLQLELADRTTDIETLREELSATPANVISSYSSVNVANEEKPMQEATPEQNETPAWQIVLITFLIILGIGLVGLCAYFFINNGALDNQETETLQTEESTVEMIEVTDFTGLKYDEVNYNGRQEKRFKIKLVYEFSTKVEKDCIITQSLKPGESVPKGSQMIFTISKGPELVRVPNTVGLSQDEAESKLNDAGFTVKVETVENDGSHTEGEVKEVNPSPGSEEIKGEKVTIKVYGPVPTTTEAEDDFFADDETTTEEDLF
ncbi:MAG: PASTA domain-containing protein [Clostridiales bacterium]|nr:PASTA domain-containing protein [Clostridiales bacterium]